MDPLSALRDLTVRNELDKISRHNDEFRFSSDYTFPCSIETAYRSKQGNLYTLETLVLFIKNLHIKHAEYIQIARSHRIPAVTFPDRKHVLDYLQGRVKSNDAIEFIVPQNPQFHSEATFGVNRVDTDHGSDQFVQKVEAFEELDLMGLINGVERPLKDREALLECKNRDFYAVLVAATKREEERLKAESNQRKDGIVAKNRIMGGSEDRGGGDEVMFDSSGSKPKMHLKGSKIGEGVPIILVPSASQTLITIYNVKEFLEDGVFMSTDAKAKLMKGPKPECVTVQKKLSRDRVVTAYEVRDKPSALKPEDWDRVVAVFVLGKEWQFKDWPFKDHADIFSKIIGFYVRYEDDSVESAKTVKQWNVKIVTVSKNKRHQDRAAALEVWDRLEEFVRSRSHS